LLPLYIHRLACGDIAAQYYMKRRDSPRFTRLFFYLDFGFVAFIFNAGIHLVNGNFPG
jgi:hypothetical protein